MNQDIKWESLSLKDFELTLNLHPRPEPSAPLLQTAPLSPPVVSSRLVLFSRALLFPQSVFSSAVAAASDFLFAQLSPYTLFTTVWLQITEPPSKMHSGKLKAYALAVNGNISKTVAARAMILFFISNSFSPALIIIKEEYPRFTGKMYVIQDLFDYIVTVL